MVKNYLRTAPVTSVIALICIIAWSITAIQARTLGETFFFSTLSQDWALWGPHYAHAPLTALSSEFMHLDGGHLAVNMVMLLLIGREVERALDTGLYVAAYLVSCLGASAMVLWFDGRVRWQHAHGRGLRCDLCADGHAGGRLPATRDGSARAHRPRIDQCGLYLRCGGGFTVGTPWRVVYRSHLELLPLLSKQIRALGGCRSHRCGHHCVIGAASWGLGITVEFNHRNGCAKEIHNSYPHCG